MVTLNALIDNDKCYELIRQHRWPNGVCCPCCGSNHVIKREKDEPQSARQRYYCKSCEHHFDDFSDSVFAGRHQPLRVWVGCLYLMGLNLSHAQIAHELDLHENEVYRMTHELCQAVVEKKPESQRSTGGCEKKGRQGRRRKLKGLRGRGTFETEKPPIFGMIERGGELVIQMLENVKQSTIKPIIQASVTKGSLIYTDEYDIYARLQEWGYAHQTVCHSAAEYAQDEDEDGDGFCEIYVNTVEGVWSLLRAWLRPHRGISQENLSQYLGFFEFVHNTRKWGKALLGSLLETLFS